MTYGESENAKRGQKGVEWHTSPSINLWWSATAKIVTYDAPVYRGQPLLSVDACPCLRPVLSLIDAENNGGDVEISKD